MYLLYLYVTRRSVKTINSMTELDMRLLTCMLTGVPTIFRPQKAYYMVSEGEARNLNDLYWWNWEDEVYRN
jgi:hypothetical protein